MEIWSGFGLEEEKSIESCWVLGLVGGSLRSHHEETWRNNLSLKK